MSAKKNEGSFLQLPSISDNGTEYLDFGSNRIITQAKVNVKVGDWLDLQLDRNLKGPGLYLLFDGDELLYIGSVSSNRRTFLKRLCEHLSPKTHTYNDKMGWFVHQNLPDSRDWNLVIICLDTDVLTIEKALILELQPVLNYHHTGRPATAMKQWGFYFDRAVTSC